MGGCFSCKSSAFLAALRLSATSPATAKVFLPDGNLHEYTNADSVSDVLRAESPEGTTFFLCCANDVDLKEHLLPLAAEKELKAGQIYFLLPRTMLHRRLQPADIAYLVARASSTLVRNGAVVVAPDVGVRKRLGAKEDKKEEKVLKRKKRGGRRRRRAWRKYRKFVPNLESIPEDSELPENIGSNTT